jgi:hypothetical protein
MTDFSMDYETMKNFIKSRLDELAMTEYAQQRDAELQALSIRLPRGHVQLIDHLAKDLDYSRQQFMARVIDLALQDCMKAYADMSKDPQQEYRRLLEIMSEVEV